METNSEDLFADIEKNDFIDQMSDEKSTNYEPLIYQNIKYSDKRVIEKIEKIESIKRKISSKDISKKFAYISLFK